MCALVNYFVKSNVLLHKLLSNKTTCMIMQLLMQYWESGRGKGRNMQQVQCYFYKDYGHIAANCAKKSCNYCKKPGHIIKECPTRPLYHQVNVNQIVVNQIVVGNHVIHATSTLTPEMVQQMIILALGLQGKGTY